jgi:WD40 repeat protein
MVYRNRPPFICQVSSLALGWESPGGPQVIAGFADGTCRVVDFGSGRETRKLTHHTADCRSVDVSPGERSGLD